MNDDVYRPQKKTINPADFGEDEIRTYSPELAKQAAEESGLQITGKIPQELLKAAEISKQMNRMPNIPGVYEDKTGGDEKFRQVLALIQKETQKYERIVLPSKGRFYDGTDGPTDGVLHVRKMTGEEEETLASPNLLRKGQAINMIFNSCMQEKHYNSEYFLTQDRVYLLIFLRGISYTHDYDVEVRCPECGKQFDEAIDLNSFMVDLCPDDYDSNTLRDKLPKTGLPFSYRLARGIDDQQIQNYKEMKVKNHSEIDDTIHYKTALLVNDISGITDKDQLQTLIRSLPIDDSNYLRDLVSNPPFGVDTSFEMDCKYCLKNFESELQVEANFFFPTGRKKKQA